MFERISDTSYMERLAVMDNAILLVFKKMCPHCKNMEKVLEKFLTTQVGVAILALDIEENPIAAETLGVERPPTLVAIKDGTVKARRAGLMNPREVALFFETA